MEGVLVLYKEGGYPCIACGREHPWMADPETCEPLLMHPGFAERILRALEANTTTGCYRLGPAQVAGHWSSS